MNVSLNPELEDYVRTKVEDGLYSSASEVVREALRLLRDQDEARELGLQRIRKQIADNLEDVKAGNWRDGEEAMAELMEMLRKRRESQNRNDD